MSETDKPVVEIWDIERLVPYAKNAKKHPPEQVKLLAGLIRDRGWTSLIVVQKSTGSIIAGHGRRLAAIELGLKRVPVVVRDVSDAEANALRLADNKSASTLYDTDLLKESLAELKDLDIDFTSLGFVEKELEFLVEDLEEMNTDLFVEDIQEAVEAKKEENTEKAAELDKTQAPLADAFGFRRLTVQQSRRVRDFMTRIEGETGQKGADALMTFLDNMGVA